MSSNDRAQVEQVLDQCSLLPILDARLTRGHEFRDSVEVWE